MNKADTESCVAVAKNFAQQLQKQGVSRVQIDGAPRYHGRVKAFIEVRIGITRITRLICWQQHSILFKASRFGEDVWPAGAEKKWCQVLRLKDPYQSTIMKGLLASLQVQLLLDV
jgi:hypothetical protein